MHLPEGAAQPSKALVGAWQGSAHPCEDRPVWLVRGGACAVPDLHLDTLVLYSPLDLLYSAKFRAVGSERANSNGTGQGGPLES